MMIYKETLKTLEKYTNIIDFLGDYLYQYNDENDKLIFIDINGTLKQLINMNAIAVKVLSICDVDDEADVIDIICKLAYAIKIKFDD